MHLISGKHHHRGVELFHDDRANRPVLSRQLMSADDWAGHETVALRKPDSPFSAGARAVRRARHDRFRLADMPDRAQVETDDLSRLLRRVESVALLVRAVKIRIRV